ncbi:MAG: DUF2384 domain-containing protein [Candidatus Omnitrophica bacterium]|nr:DUF2384 domain-containing protein [Candidatus Omnitrophota bacterium]
MGSPLKSHADALSAALADELLPTRRRASAVRSAERLRQWFGLSQSEFADMVGVSRQTVNRWKMTGTGPTPDSAEAGLLALLAQVKAIAEQTWDSQDDFRRWLRAPLPILRMKRPIDYFKPSGLTVVLDLVRAEAGGGYS